MPLRGAVDVAVVHVSAGLGGGPDDLLGAVGEGGRHHLDEVPRVGERGHARLGRQPGDALVLLRAGRGRVAEQHADAERPIGQIGREPGQ